MCVDEAVPLMCWRHVIADVIHVTASECRFIVNFAVISTLTETFLLQRSFLCLQPLTSAVIAYILINQSVSFISGIIGHMERKHNKQAEKQTVN